MSSIFAESLRDAIEAANNTTTVNVQGNTDLQGAVIASTQEAVEQGRNKPDHRHADG